jgi:ketosteroid isomerase-like protein
MPKICAMLSCHLDGRTDFAGLVKDPSFATPQGAEAAFYHAFEQADIEAMMTVWADADDIECIHPLRPRLHGKAAVRSGWEEIFADSPAIRFEIREAQYYQDGGLAIHVVHEHIKVNGESGTRPPIIATNVYRRDAAGWRMILHHASPAPPTRRAATRQAPQRAKGVVH